MSQELKAINEIWSVNRKKRSEIEIGSIVSSFIQFVFIVCQVEYYRNVSKLS